MAEARPWYLARAVPFVTSLGALLVYFSARSFVYSEIGAAEPLTGKLIVLVWFHVHLVTAFGAWSGYARYGRDQDRIALYAAMLNTAHFVIFACFWARFIVRQF